MALKIDNQNNVLQFVETTEPAGNPPAGHSFVYVKSDGKIYVKDEAGTESQPGITEIVSDTTPVLGGNLDVNDFSIIGKPAETSTSDGNAVTLVGGDGGSSSGIGGAINITGGDSIGTTGKGGDVNITAGGAAGSAQLGGDVTITGGASTLSGGGDIILTGGTGASSVHGSVGILNPAGATNGSELRFFELAVNGGNYLELKAPDTLSQTRSWFLPTNDPADGAVLTMGASGQSTWAALQQVFTEDVNGNIFAGAGAATNLGGAATGNFFVGVNAGFTATSMDDSVAIGHSSLLYSTTGTRSIAIGRQALEGVSGSSMTAQHNIAIGYRAGQKVTLTATRNTFMGSFSGDALGEIDDNTIIGYFGLSAITAGDQNTALGSSTGGNVTGTAAGNVLIGYGAGPSTIGSINNELYIHNAATDTPLIHGDFSTTSVTINGDLEVTGTLTGGGAFTNDGGTQFNIFSSSGGTGGNLGATAQYNFLAGHSAGPQITTPDNNIHIGYQTGNQASAQTGASNIVIGPFTASGLTSGTQNTMIGVQIGGNITTGSDNVLIGRFGPTTNVSNQLYIGQSTGSNDPALLAGIFGKPNTRTGELDVTASKQTQVNSHTSNAKQITYVLANTTANDTETNLYIDATNASEQIPIPDDSEWLVEVSIVGKDTGGSRDAVYRHTFACQRNGGFSQVRGTVSKETFYEFSASYDSSVFVNNTSDILEVRVIGDSTIEMDWVATVRITEIIAPT